MFTYNILIYQFEPEPLILRGFPALLIHLSVENGIISHESPESQALFRSFFLQCGLIIADHADNHHIRLIRHTADCNLKA